jgi:type II secretion system protein H
MTSRTHSSKFTRIGFTLVELIAVVAMVGITAAVAIPGVTSRMRDRRVSEAAQRVAQTYGDARMRALGRGSAILVRFESGRFRLREAQRGPLSLDPACAALPVSSCTTTNWNDSTAGQYRDLTGLDLSLRSEYGTGSSKVEVSLQNEAGTPLPNFDVCFTPSGRAFSRSNFAQDLLPLSAATTAEVERSGFRTRRVLVLPNGRARVL